MRILVLCDDHYHPAATVMQGLAPLAALGYEFDWCTDAREWSAARMDGYPLTILSKSNSVTAADDTPWQTPAVAQAFAGYVRRGNGLLVTHSGTVGYKDLPTLRRLIGGVFAKHPKQCPVRITPLRGHAISEGLPHVTITDEHYFMDFDDSSAVVFLTSESPNGTQPAGWTRLEGQGRVCVLTPGHNLDVWLHPTYQTVLANALRWVRREG